MPLVHLEEAIAAAMFQELAAESREDQSRDAEPRGSDYRCDQATSFLQLSCNVFSGSCMAKPCLQAARCVEITFLAISCPQAVMLPRLHSPPTLTL